ncbi:MAG: T9SS type A sorting domain-containing protein [Flavobacteriales bacterium]|nr:T9SS type A sorting domain-containing protein [Flavobacteriales bacterium]
MKLHLSLFLVFTISTLSFSQDAQMEIVVNSSSNTSSYLYNVGEIFITQNHNTTLNSKNIDVIKNSDEVIIYPNPFTKIIYFKTKENIDSIFIFDLSGKLVLETNVKSNQVDLQELPNGSYILTTNLIRLNAIKIIKQ